MKRLPTPPSLLCTLAILALCLVPACRRDLPETLEGAFHQASYWVGTFDVDELTWHIGIEPDRDSKPVIDLTSLWRSRQPAASHRVLEDGSLEIGLPESFGVLLVDGRDGDQLVGSVVREDGAKGTYRASPGIRVSAKEAELPVESRDAMIAATLMTPAGDGPFPAIVMVHGSGDSDRTVPSYRFWGDYFVQRGIAVALYDKRGNGSSTGDWRSVGFGPRGEDVGAIVDWLADHEAIDSRAIGLMGVSQGVWVAGLAARDNPNVAFMIAVSGPAVSPARSDGYAGWVQSRQAGLSAEEADERRALFDALLESIRDPGSDATWRRFSAALDEAKRKSWFAKRPLDPGPREELRSGWYPLIMDHDPAPVLEATDIPVLWLYGEQDSQLDARESVEVLSKLQASGKRYEIRVFPSANHGIAVPLSVPWERTEYTTSAPGFFEAIKEFVETHAGVGDRGQEQS